MDLNSLTLPNPRNVRHNRRERERCLFECLFDRVAKSAHTNVRTMRKVFPAGHARHACRQRRLPGGTEFST